MRFSALGMSGLKPSVVGLGTWPLGGGIDWGPVAKSDALRVIDAALEQGINLIDTAPIYADGTSEQLLGQALREKRGRIFLCSKCGLVKNGSWTDHDLRPVSIRSQLESSLTRLQTDYLDLYFIHYPDPNIPLAEAVGTLARLKEEGKIRHIGLCNVSVEQLAQAAQVTQIACVQNEYSLLHPQKGENVFAYCREKEILFMSYGTLGGGFLSGKYKREPNLRRADARNYFYKIARGAAFEFALQKAARVSQVAADKGVPAAAVAGAWALQKADFILCGAKSALQVAQNAQAADVTLTVKETAFLEQTDED